MVAGSTDEQFLGGAQTPDTPAQAPPPGAVRRAVEKARSDGKSRVSKVIYLDEEGDSVGEWASQQIPESPWDGMQQAGLQEPPYRLEQLVFLAETHPIHSASLEQKTADICGKGWEWEAVNPDAADEQARDKLNDWFESLSPDDVDMQEVVASMWSDVETVGWGLGELTRNPQGALQRIYHVPGHTVRAHRDGFRLCQVRDNRKVWFRRWGAPDIDGKRVEVDAKTGQLSINAKTGQEREIPEPRKANDMFVVKRPSRRSTWYGIPGYISSVGWITLALAARDDNLMFFANRREPRWAIVLSGLSDDTDLEEDIRRAFVVDMKQPYRNIIIPLTGPGKIDFQKLSDTAKDGSFPLLSDRADKAIMVAHRVPAGRIANAQVGPLGGNNTAAENLIYKDAVVTPGQELLNSRLNKLIEIEYGKTETGKEGAKPTWKIKMDDLDVSSEREDIDLTIKVFHGDLITLREARHRLRLGPLMKPVKAEPSVDPATGLPVGPTEPEGEPATDPETGDPVGPEEVESEYNDLLFTELPGASGQAAGAGHVPPGTGGLGGVENDADREAALAFLGKEVAEMLETGRALHDSLVEAAQETK